MARILVVDDDANFQGLIATFLEDSGHTLDTAADPQGLAQALRGTLPDLIILDMQMPGGGAPMARQMLEGTPQRAAIPLLLCSGMREERMKEWFPAAPRRRYLSKPLHKDAFLKTVAELLNAPPI